MRAAQPSCAGHPPTDCGSPVRTSMPLRLVYASHRAHHPPPQAIPFMVLFGGEELAAGNVKVKDMVRKSEEVVALADLVGDLQQRVAAGRQTGLL